MGCTPAVAKTVPGLALASSRARRLDAADVPVARIWVTFAARARINNWSVSDTNCAEWKLTPMSTSCARSDCDPLLMRRWYGVMHAVHLHSGPVLWSCKSATDISLRATVPAWVLAIGSP